MDIEYFKVAAIGIIGSIIGIYFKSAKSEYSTLIGTCVFIVLFFLGMNKIQYIVEKIHEISAIFDVDIVYLKIIFKIIAISYISEFASDICKDCGYQSISTQILFIGKITAFMICIPVFSTLIKAIFELI